MMRLRKLLGLPEPNPEHTRFVGQVLHDWDEILTIYALLGIQVDAELPKEMLADDQPGEH